MKAILRPSLLIGLLTFYCILQGGSSALFNRIISAAKMSNRSTATLPADNANKIHEYVANNNIPSTKSELISREQSGEASEKGHTAQLGVSETVTDKFNPTTASRHASLSSSTNVNKIAKENRVGSSLTATIPLSNKNCRQTFSIPLSEDIELDDVRLEWYDLIKTQSKHIIVNPREWADEAFREDDGFAGVDFCHSCTASVRILEYALLSSIESVDRVTDSNQLKLTPRLVGAVYFSPRAESHRGLCHGGSMTAVMDDVIGWLGFCCSGEVIPWDGYTVQVNTALKKSIEVGSLMKIEAWVDRFEGSRKVWIKAILSDPILGTIHSESEGLFLKATSKEKPQE